MTDEVISPLRRRMIKDMTIRKLAPKTQQGYIRNVKAFAAAQLPQNSLIPNEPPRSLSAQPDWESSPEYRWVPSRVDEHDSRATSLIEQLGLPD
jgi:hypothetical protein